MARERVVVVAGGSPISDALAEGLEDAWVIAADSGVDRAHGAGLRPHVVVGDLDSASEDGVARARAVGARVVAHPRDKDASDLELALELALAEGPAELVVLGGFGGRLDHLLVNAAVLGSPRWGGAQVSWRGDDAEVLVVRGQRARALAAGAVFSVVAWGGPAREVTVRGARWPLTGAELSPWSSRGLSNEAIGGTVEVAVGEGVALWVIPAWP